MQWKCSAEARKLIEQEIKKYDDLMDKSTFLEAKTIMDNYFGKENNQIVKVDFENVDKYIRANIASTYDAARIESFAKDPNYCGIFNKHSVLIRFPELTITNSDERSHNIKDLWVKFYIDHNFKMGNGLYGIRSTLSLPEAQIGYLHSHLHSQYPIQLDHTFYFDQFCTGTGEIVQVMRLLNIDGFDKINFTLFCLHLKNFVVWESLEGVPYFHFSKVRTGRSQPVLNERTLETLATNPTKRLVNYLKEKVANMEMQTLKTFIIPIIIQDEVSIEINDDLLIMLGNIVESMSNSSLTSIRFASTGQLLCNREPDGRYVSLQNRRTSNTVVLPTVPMFKFKGEDIYLKIEGFESNKVPEPQNTNTNVYIHPSVAESFAKCFSSDFAEACFTFETPIKKNTLEDFLNTTESNLLPMHQHS